MALLLVTGAPGGISANVILTVSGADQDGDSLAYAASGLPPGLSTDAASGVISGVVETGSEGTFPITVTVSDPTPGDQASAGFTWVAAPAPPPKVEDLLSQVTIIKAGGEAAATRAEAATLIDRLLQQMHSKLKGGRCGVAGVGTKR